MAKKDCSGNGNCKNRTYGGVIGSGAFRHHENYGHKQVAQLDFFDYVCGITIGSIGAELATELEAPERPLIALAIYGVASVTLNTISHKFPKTRKYVNGTPSIPSICITP